MWLNSSVRLLFIRTLFCVRPAGRTTIGCKSRSGPAGGTLSDWTMVSLVRENLAKRWLDEQEADIRHGMWVRLHKSSNPDTCTEACYVYRTGISVKVVRITRGYLLFCREANIAAMRYDGTAEVSREHSSLFNSSEGSNQS